MTNRPGFVHMVFFYLKNQDSPEDADLLIKGAKQHLAGIPSVLRFDVGAPAETPRDVVDNSYGVGLIVEFADKAGHDIYQDHPDHLKFIEECSALWSHVKVYDTLI